ncbi:MAG: DUF1385 domain-containing protein [Armatimonadetes bacterium]|nr:DUF1385 domain-containing protein [Armatimonadota bacterium]
MLVRDLQDIIKQVPPLSPRDSAAKAVRLLRAHNLPSLPVAEGQQLIGMVSETDILQLTAEDSEARDVLRRVSVAEIMRPMAVIASEFQPLTDLAEVLRTTPVSAVPVASSDGRYLGLLLPRELLAALSGEPIVPPIAGLATPFGVYLTTGALRAGASDFALAATGAALMIINLVAQQIIDGVFLLADQVFPVPQEPSPPTGTIAVLAAIIIYGLQVGLFLLLLRLSPLTGTHGAEHMVVRAVEEGEDLRLEKVRQMPRVHPRCGTNIMALLILVVITQEFFSQLNASVNEATGAFALFVLVMIVLLTWRRLGAALQRWVTTKRPSDRQLGRAVAVAEDLLGQVRARPSATVPVPRRIWNAGFIQVVSGFLAVYFVAEYAEPLLAQAWRLVAG